MKKFATIVDLLNSVTVWCWRLYSYCIYLQFGSLHSPGRFMCSFSRKAAWNVLCTQIDRLSLSPKKKVYLYLYDIEPPFIAWDLFQALT